MKLKDRIERAMKARGMKQADLCRMTGMSSSKVSQLLKGTTYDPRLSTAIALSNALDVSLDYLAGLTDDPAPKFIGNVQPDAVATRDNGTTTVFQVKGSDVHALVDDYEQCTPERRRMLASLARDLRDQSKETAAGSEQHEMASDIDVIERLSSLDLTRGEREILGAYRSRVISELPSKKSDGYAFTPSDAVIVIWLVLAVVLVLTGGTWLVLIALCAAMLIVFFTAKISYEAGILEGRLRERKNIISAKRLEYECPEQVHDRK